MNGRMDELKVLGTVFATVLLAEMGDKTQLATLLFSAQGETSRWGVFVAASLALVLATGVGVLAGGWVSRHLGPRTLQWIAGAGFVAIGLWTLWSARAA